MFEEWMLMVGATFGALVPITNPFSTAPVFASLTQHFPDNRRKQQARAAACYTASVLFVSLFAGAVILTFFGISMPVLRIGGGLVVARVGFAMLNPEPEARVSEADREDAQHMEDIAFTPIAMPLLAARARSRSPSAWLPRWTARWNTSRLRLASCPWRSFPGLCCTMRAEW